MELRFRINDPLPLEGPSAPALVDCCPENPFRPLSWRWEASRALRETRRRPRWARDDPWVGRARRYMAALAKSRNDPSHPRLARLDPAVHGACLVRNGPERTRWELEARLLSGQSDEAIAARCGVQEGVVGAYEAVFYAVRGSLRSPDWVLAAALGPRALDGFPADDTGLLWKAVAYRGGPHALDALTGSGPGETVDPRRANLLKTLTLCLTTPVTAGSARTWLGLQGRLAENENSEADAGAGAVTRPITAAPFDGLDRRGDPVPAGMSARPVGGREPGSRAGAEDILTEQTAPAALFAPELDLTRIYLRPTG